MAKVGNTHYAYTAKGKRKQNKLVKKLLICGLLAEAVEI